MTKPVTANVCQTCGKPKRSYATRADARRAARSVRVHKKIRTYRCGNYWHLTSVPADRAAAIRSGDFTKGTP